jgi:thioredoxin 1
MAAVITVGCSHNVRPIQSLEAFDEQVLLAEKPVLVEFYKGGCPTCLALEPRLDMLADEYKGRIEFVRFELMTPVFVLTSEELQDRYTISYFPTVILFYKGEEKERWIMDYDLNSYRPALNRVLKRQERKISTVKSYQLH